MFERVGAIVSIDAMGCQMEIAKQIVNDGGDFVLAVKDNHPKLCEAVHQFFQARYENENFVALVIGLLKRDTSKGSLIGKRKKAEHSVPRKTPIRNDFLMRNPLTEVLPVGYGVTLTVARVTQAIDDSLSGCVRKLDNRR